MIIDKVYKGSTEFIKGYKGTTLLWEPGLPSGYRQLEYIESVNAISSSSGPHIVLDVYGDEVSKYDIKFRSYTVPSDRGAGALMFVELGASP